MPTFDPSRGRRHAVPPLWLVPLLLMASIGAVVYVSATVGGLLGLVGAAVLLARIEPRVDAYVRGRDRAED